MKPKHSLLITGLIGLVVLGTVSITCKSNRATGFNKENVAEIKSLLAGLDSSTYRVVLPVFSDNGAIGNETLGTLPVTEVERIASSKNIQYDPSGNLQIVLVPDGGGAGSHTESCTPCKGKGLDVITRIDKVVQNFDKSTYTFIK